MDEGHRLIPYSSAFSIKHNAWGNICWHNKWTACKENDPGNCQEDSRMALSLTSKLGILCRKQVMKTTKGQSSGCIITPAAWAQLTWKAVGQRPCEHCTQQPAVLFLRFLQKTHFYDTREASQWFQELTVQSSLSFPGPNAHSQTSRSQPPSQTQGHKHTFFESRMILGENHKLWPKSMGKGWPLGQKRLPSDILCYPLPRDL